MTENNLEEIKETQPGEVLDYGPAETPAEAVQTNTVTISESDKKTASKIKIAGIIILIALVFSLAFYYKGLFAAATINGSVISRWSVIERLERQAGKKVLDQIIMEKVLDAEAQKNGVSVSVEEVNKAIKDLEDQITAQGSTLNDALLAEGMTVEDLMKQVVVQKTIEKLLAEKLQVSDADIAQVIESNKITIPEGREEEYRKMISEQIKQQKISQEAMPYIESLKAQSTIRYFVNY